MERIVTMIPFAGSIANAILIAAGAGIGIAAAGRMPKRVPESLLPTLGVFTAILGVGMAQSGTFGLSTLICLALGTAIGSALDINGMFERFAEWTKKKIRVRDERFVDAFVGPSVMFVMGSMGILGAIEEGLGGFPAILLTKAIMDGVSSVVFGSTMGIGVIFASVPVFVYQAVISLCASSAQGMFTPAIMGALSGIGGVMLVSIALNLIGAAKIKTANQLPAIVLAVAYAALT